MMNYNYGLVKSNLESFSAIQTSNYLKLLQEVKNEEGVLVIGGGEIFFQNGQLKKKFIHKNKLGFK